DFLQNPLALMSVVLAFVLANSAQAESGLLAVTVMGITLVNQKSVSIKHIIEFKENLRVLLISGLFIILAARLKLSDLNYFSIHTLIFLATLIIVARPVAVFISTIGNKYKWQERLFVAWLAPKGIVAAAVSSVLAISLIETGHPQAKLLVPLTFITIIGTVVVYSLTSATLAHRLHVAQPNPQGVLFIGAHFWARTIAKTLQDEGYQVRLVDRNRGNIKAARIAGLPVYYGNILAHQALISINLDGIGHLLALTANNEVNSLAALHFGDILGRSEVYQLPLAPQQNKDSETVSRDLRGRLLFNKQAGYAYLAKRFTTGAIIKVSRMTNEFNYKDFLKLYGSSALPLFLINEAGGDLTIFTADDTIIPTTGQKLISLVDPIKKETKDTQHKNAKKDDETDA
ncbi:MAG TPA: sodium:proton exchanger, partial [Actinobacteria bacterium]|nr:sodium:proton exchanger [Actinomycetes bacterium]HEX21587.1 sodium:proton exchanger [Actinomycetota bacterium]